MAHRTVRARRRRVRRAAIDGLVWAATILLVVVGWPAAVGGQFGVVIVRGPSMQPTYHGGDVVLISRLGSPERGDVVSYPIESSEGGDAHIVHRVVGGDQHGLVTRGDNRESVDPWRPSADDVDGTVLVLIPWVGHLLSVWFGLVAAAAASVVLTCALWPPAAPTAAPT